MVEQQERTILQAPFAADVLTPLASDDAMLDVARIVDETNRYALFVLGGILDEGTAPQLLEHLVAAARIDAVDLVIVDLLALVWFGAPGARALEAAWRAAERHGAELVVARPSDFVRRALEATGLSSLLADEPGTDAEATPANDTGSWRWE